MVPAVRSDRGRRGGDSDRADTAVQTGVREEAGKSGDEAEASEGGCVRGRPAPADG
jgi:hypothetical protein